MSKLAELDQALHYHFLQYEPYRDLSLVSRAIQLKGRWMYQKKLVVLFSREDRLWYWNIDNNATSESRQEFLEFCKKR